jgi:hypothetical protein
MPRDYCRLCGVNTDLQLSHILPAFVFRWMKETSGNGHLRSGETPNQRVQDGLKFHWLCTSCENLLGCSETAFADQLIHPYSRGELSRFIYGEWLLHFCVSVSWRVLHFYREQTGLKGYEPEAIASIEATEVAWQEFLLGRRPHPETFEQHLIPFDAIESISFPKDEVSSNLNRYLMRTVDVDTSRREKAIYVYTKLGRFAILGFVREEQRSRWQGTKVHVKKGVIEPRIYQLPRAFFEYLNGKARRTAELLASISPRQSDKIDQSFRSNINKYIGSDEFQAMQNDVRMFGDAAFTRSHASKDGKS